MSFPSLAGTSFPSPAVLGALLAACALVAGARPATATSRPPDVRIETGVSERFYDVRGATADEVFASIQRQGLGGDAGLSASGLTTSDLSFALVSSPEAEGCELAALELDARVSVTLPRHAALASLDAATRRQWEAYEALVEFHEYRHVEIEFQGVQELQARLQRGDVRAASGESCAAFVERAVREQADVTRRRHAEFHAHESRSVREAQARLLAEIDALDRLLSREKAEIDRLAAAIDALDAERSARVQTLNALVEQHGGALPPAEFARAQEIGASVDALTAEIHATVALRNSRITQYNDRIVERRDLTERLAWTR